MENVKRAKIASHAFALMMVALAMVFVFNGISEKRRVADQQLRDWTAAVAKVDEAQVRRRTKSCQNRITYTFVADGGRQLTHETAFRCDKDRWFWGNPIPVSDAIDIIYDKKNPDRSRALLELQKDISIEIYPLLLLVLFVWVFSYLIARVAIKLVLKLLSMHP